MKKLLVAALAAFTLAGTAAATAPEPHFNRTIYVVNQSKVVSNAEIADDLPALQAGLEDFGRYWGGSIKLAVVDKVPYRAWGITISDKADCMACLGYHDVRSGVPYGKVFTDPAYNWTVTFTHELFELAADPYIHRAEQVGYTFYLVEVSDPVEDERYAYTRPSAAGKPVKISDFVTNQWYRRGLKGGVYDFNHKVKRSLQLLTNGYVSWWDGKEWMQDFAWGKTRHTQRPTEFRAALP